jgi:hypothetical protein
VIWPWLWFSITIRTTGVGRRRDAVDRVTEPMPAPDDVPGGDASVDDGAAHADAMITNTIAGTHQDRAGPRAKAARATGP